MSISIRGRSGAALARTAGAAISGLALVFGVAAACGFGNPDDSVNVPNINPEQTGPSRTSLVSSTVSIPPTPTWRVATSTPAPPPSSADRPVPLPYATDAPWTTTRSPDVPYPSTRPTQDDDDTDTGSPTTPALTPR